jgi:hypothetical protein
MAETAHKEKKKKPRAKFYIPRDSIFAQLAIIFMLLSAIFRLIGVWGRWGDVFFRNTQIILPLCCNILYIFCLFFLGKKGFFLSSIPVVFGVAFFIIKSLGFESWIHTVLCILLYLLILVLYCATVFGFIRTKWLLPPLFGLPFIYHIFIEDLPMLNDTVNPMTFTYGMQELSVLCIMLGLFCVGLGLKKNKPLEESDLPKIKDPVVVDKDSQPQQTGEEP